MTLAEAITWSNTNSGALLVLLTAVYSIATIAMFWVMRRANSIAAANLTHSTALANATFRPYVSLSVKYTNKSRGHEPSIPYAYAVLHNTGRTQALNVTVSLAPPLTVKVILNGREHLRTPYFFEHSVFNIAPDERLTDSIGYTAALFIDYQPPIFRGTLRYRDVTGTEYSEPVEINFDKLKLASPIQERED